MMKSTMLILAVLFVLSPLASMRGQDTGIPTTNQSSDRTQEAKLGSDATKAASKEPRFVALEQMLTNVVLVGMFTVDKKKIGDFSEERYEIKSIQKLSDDDDLWALEARVKYGKHDFTGPIVTSIKWADQTPVMTMDRVLIPGLGTFSARVLFHDGKYAGTWTHDEHGGHLFGRIEAVNKDTR